MSFRNKITMLDPSITVPKLADLRSGEMFVYRNVEVGSNVYMATSTIDAYANTREVVFLPTGSIYKVGLEKAVTRISQIQITSPIA